MNTQISDNEPTLARRRSKIQMYAHFVWGTRGRRDVLINDVERQVHRSIVAEASRLGCKVLAINGIANHVHLLVWIPATLCPATLVKQIKGASTYVLNKLDLRSGQSTYWQDGYACFA